MLRLAFNIFSTWKVHWLDMARLSLKKETEHYRPFKLCVFLQQWYAMTWLPLVLGLDLSEQRWVPTVHTVGWTRWEGKYANVCYFFQVFFVNMYPNLSRISSNSITMTFVQGLRLSVGWSQDPPDLLPERCGILTFDHNRMPPSSLGCRMLGFGEMGW